MIPPNVAFSKDPAPVFHELQKSEFTGRVIVPAFGGATCDTEFEFLTGNSFFFVTPGDTPFTQLNKYLTETDNRSLVSVFNENGYRTVGVHTHNNSIYSRDVIYPLLGFRERRSSALVALEDCPVADSGIRAALKGGSLRPPPDKERFTVYSRGTTFLAEGGLERGRVPLLGRELAMDVKVFFQSNAAMLELLIRDLIDAASAADRDLPLADLYCGVGTFASFLGPLFAGIDLVEENKAAMALARENVSPGKAARGKVNYVNLTDTAWVNTLKRQSKDPQRWGFMVLDPPREGLSGPLREFLAGSGPDLAAYVSCDPATLARDSRVLLEGGYKLKELTLYDFYPQTAHIESLAVFSRR